MARNDGSDVGDEMVLRITGFLLDFEWICISLSPKMVSDGFFLWTKNTIVKGWTGHISSDPTDGWYDRKKPQRARAEDREGSIYLWYFRVVPVLFPSRT